MNGVNMTDINVKVDEKQLFEKDNAVIAQDVLPDGEVQTRVDLVDEEIEYDEDREYTPEEIESLRQEWADDNYPLPDGFPDSDTLATWSEQYGRVRVRRVAPKEAYVLRRMSRAEFKQFLNAVEDHGGKPIENKMFQEELMVEMCTLYPKVTINDVRGITNPFASIAAAGTASILSADIQEISNMLAEAIGPIEEL
jgi:hypothetical protein